MKIHVIGLLIALLATYSGNSQVAVNFTCEDCTGVSHDLFTETDTGNVIVLCWVMPCISCIDPMQTTHNAVQSFQQNYPNKVFMYLCDDFADTDCTTLGDWAISIGLTNTTNFSNASIKMSDYGFNEMNKVVVIGGTDHVVYFRADNTVNGEDLMNAIQTAIDESPSSSMSNSGSGQFRAKIFPNPSVSITKLIIYNSISSETEISFYNQLGQKLNTIFKGNLQINENSFELNTDVLNPGIYFINIKDKMINENFKLIVSE
jgi:hypothetical protein